MLNCTTYTPADLAGVLEALAGLPSDKSVFTMIDVLQAAPELGADALHATAYAAIVERSPATRLRFHRAGWSVQARTRAGRTRLKFLRTKEGASESR